MVANIFSLFRLKIDVSVTSLITRGGTQGPWLGSRDWDEGKSCSPSHLPRGLRDKAPELVTWQWHSSALQDLRPPGLQSLPGNQGCPVGPPSQRGSILGCGVWRLS